MDEIKDRISNLGEGELLKGIKSTRRVLEALYGELHRRHPELGELTNEQLERLAGRAEVLIVSGDTTSAYPYERMVIEITRRKVVCADHCVSYASVEEAAGAIVKAIFENQKLIDED